MNTDDANNNNSVFFLNNSSPYLDIFQLLAEETESMIIPAAAVKLREGNTLPMEERGCSNGRSDMNYLVQRY